MRTERKEIKTTATKTVYIAYDGTEFTNYDQCWEYESAHKEELFSKIAQCPELENYPNFTGEEHQDSNSFRWFRPSTHDDIATLSKAYSLTSDNAEFDDKLIGTYICVEESESSGDIWCTTIDDAISYAKHILDKIGYDLVVTPKESHQNTVHVTLDSILQ